jgi:UPF0042 nucleotide-binding protein
MPENEKFQQSKIPDLVIITGLSGSGMSSATNAFEDLGFFCVDNLPVTMLSTFARLMQKDEEEKQAIAKAALVINIRERHFLPQFTEEMKKLEKKGLSPFVLFFEAANDVLQRRFSETRRPHPADEGEGLMNAINAEREAMQAVHDRADLIIDTTEHTVHTLRALLMQKFGHATEGAPMSVRFLSFGHKYGTPREMDVMFDVRHLPNPYFVPELREVPGTDQRVIDFLEKEPDVKETIRRFDDLLNYLLPLYKREGKSYLTIGIGCTGGKHRSVMIAESLARNTEKDNFNVSVIHRDVHKKKLQ